MRVEDKKHDMAIVTLYVHQVGIPDRVYNNVVSESISLPYGKSNILSFRLSDGTVVCTTLLFTIEY